MLTDTPRIIIGQGDVEILFINKAAKTAKIVVYMDVTPEEFNTSQLTMETFHNKMHSAIAYMVAEGWVPPYSEDNKWKIECQANRKQNK